MAFQCRGIDPTPFTPLFLLSDEELADRGIIRVVADAPDAYPCRVSLTRVPVGEELLLLNYTHQANPASPYRAAGPIFVSRGGEAAVYRNELPPILKNRILSLRAYDSGALIVDAQVAEGPAVVEGLNRLLDRPDVAHVDIHFAGRGCFATRFERA